MPNHRHDRRRDSDSLSEGGFKRKFLADREKDAILTSFDGMVAEVIGVVNDGKEATVYLCKARTSVGVDLLAAKVYLAQKFRAFNSAMEYQDHHNVHDLRLSRAMKRRSRTGRRSAHSMWIAREWLTMELLYEEGANVPRPYAHSGDIILMEYIGTGVRPGQMLSNVTLSKAEALHHYDVAMDNVELLLRCNRIHADLSAYNILYHNGELRIIDFPQAVDPRVDSSACMLLTRDIRNLCDYFQR